MTTARGDTDQSEPSDADPGARAFDSAGGDPYEMGWRFASYLADHLISDLGGGGPGNLCGRAMCERPCEYESGPTTVGPRSLGRRCWGQECHAGPPFAWTLDWLRSAVLFSFSVVLGCLDACSAARLPACLLSVDV